MSDAQSTLAAFRASRWFDLSPGRVQKRIARVLDTAHALSGVESELYGLGHIRFVAGKKAFAYMLNDHHGDGLIVIAAKSTLGDQRRLVSGGSGRYCIPAYLGKSGWVSLRIDLPAIDWAELAEFLAAAHRLQAAGKRGAGATQSRGRAGPDASRSRRRPRPRRHRP